MSSPAVRLYTEFALAPMRAATSMITHWTAYASANLPATPMRVSADLARWVAATSVRERPRWAHEATVARTWPLARLRDYSTSEDGQVPTLVLPPQAGHDSCIVDYAPGQSQLITLREAGLTRLFCLDWRGATEQTADAGIEDYLDLLSETVDLLGGRVNLVGDCQGGWLATLWAALHPAKVNTLTIAGAPIDFHAGGSGIRDWLRVFGALGRAAGATELAAYRAMVDRGGGVQRGANQVLGFKLLEPVAELDRNLALWANIRDPQYVSRHVEFTNWFEWIQDIPGPFYLWIVEHLFAGNELVAGTLAAGGRRVDLGAIDCPVFLIAGSKDHITPPAQVWTLADHIGTDRVTRREVDAGHLGLFMGHEALREAWLPLMQEVRALSTPL
ncbi:alpha/beta fold hydrolase [Pseudonocardia eucalypti]|uniref:Alpha/beta fold hydrolase n=1 Tax=Pseudonocardia eucalypti TaxID=648755 RepID=A0ABP9QTR0_9PSEU|nr:poly(3-hydroxyalkanoate) synthetase [Pseudonocardia eucalypti]